jgi:citrate lyase subunit beta/citryl-CoA lyase
MVVLRSVMYVPGNNMRMIEKAPTLPADVIVLDLEDSVPPAEKETARFMVKDSIKKAAEGGADIYCRINGWVTGLTDEDLNAVVQEGLNGIVLPKTEGREEVLKLEKRLEELEKERGLKPGSIAVQLLIETARGVVLAYEAATASKRVNSLVFGAVDYCRDMRVELTKEATETFHARAQVALVARASGTIAIDNPYTVYADVEGFTKDTKFGRQLGYEGRMLIHPTQIEPSHQVYTPPKDAVDYARRVVQVFEEGMKKGTAAVGLEGKMIDWAVYRSQKDVLSAADTIAQKEKLRKEKAKT